MKLKEAVWAMLDGHVVEESTFYLRKRDGKIQFTSKSNGLNAGWVDVGANALIWMAETEYEIYQPKSPIEKAIEWEAKRAVALNDVNGEAACFRVSDAMRRIVNLTLDEAKRVLTTDTQHKDYTIVINKRIDALKVKG